MIDLMKGGKGPALMCFRIVKSAVHPEVHFLFGIYRRRVHKSIPHWIQMNGAQTGKEASLETRLETQLETRIC